MTKPLRIEPEAVEELEQAVRWYEDRRPGLGQELLAAVDACLDLVAHWPGSGSPVPGLSDLLPVRRAPVRRSPYHVVYLEAGSAIRILAFAHDRRKPGYWRTRA